LDRQADFRSQRHCAAQLFGNRGHHSEAINDLSAAIKLRPTYAEAYYVRAQTYERLGQRASATADARTYKELRSRPTLRKTEAVPRLFPIPVLPCQTFR